jgi:hypothetical protein
MQENASQDEYDVTLNRRCEGLTVLRYLECVRSIYESMSFVFVGPHAIQNFLGPCVSRDGTMNSVVSFLKNVKNLEVSLPITFPGHIPCCLGPSMDAGRHSAYDFHWLRLSEMESCQDLKIWIDARHRGTSSHSYYKPVYGSMYTPITELDGDSLQRAFSRLGDVTVRCNVIISTPLTEAIEPESGFVESIEQHARVHIWKRHSGDQFYPLPSYRGASPKGLINIVPLRQVPLERLLTAAISLH